MRQDQFDVRLTLGGVSLGTFDTKEGGEHDSDESFHRPGAMRPRYTLGNYRQTGNVTLTRDFIPVRDTPFTGMLKNGVGNLSGQITVQPLDVNGAPDGPPLDPYNVLLKKYQPPDHDSESGDFAPFELEFTVNG